MFIMHNNVNIRECETLGSLDANILRKWTHNASRSRKLSIYIHLEIKIEECLCV